MKKLFVVFLAVICLISPMSTLAEGEGTISLAEYNGGYFSIMLPEGWQIETMGQYSAFAFRAWNPNDPSYEIFYYGTLTPLMKSEAAREWNASYAAYTGENSTYQFFADAPAIDVFDISTLFYAFPDIAAFSKKYSGSYLLPGFSFPELRNLTMIGTIPMQTLVSSVCASEGIAYGSLQSESGDDCYGCFSASIWAAPSQYIDGIDLLPTSAMNVSGVIAPQEDFNNVQNILTQSIFSLTFTQAYIDEARNYAEQTGDAALASNAERQAIFDSYCNAWNEAFRN